jgi:hypothetical protein
MIYKWLINCNCQLKSQSEREILMDVLSLHCRDTSQRNRNLFSTHISSGTSLQYFTPIAFKSRIKRVGAAKICTYCNRRPCIPDIDVIPFFRTFLSKIWSIVASNTKMSIAQFNNIHLSIAYTLTETSKKSKSNQAFLEIPVKCNNVKQRGTTGGPQAISDFRSRVNRPLNSLLIC